MTCFNLDEYVGLPAGHEQSYRATIARELTDGLGISPERVNGPDPAPDGLPTAGSRYEELISGAGGVDVQVLGIGSDGHLAFNEPGSSLASRTRIKTLTAETQKDNARFFGSADRVPTHVLTQGLGTILATPAAAKTQIAALDSGMPVRSHPGAGSRSAQPQGVPRADSHRAVACTIARRPPVPAADLARHTSAHPRLVNRAQSFATRPRHPAIAAVPIAADRNLQGPAAAVSYRPSQALPKAPGGIRLALTRPLRVQISSNADSQPLNAAASCCHVRRAAARRKSGAYSHSKSCASADRSASRRRGPSSQSAVFSLRLTMPAHKDCSWVEFKTSRPSVTRRSHSWRAKVLQSRTSGAAQRAQPFCAAGAMVCGFDRARGAVAGPNYNAARAQPRVDIGRRNCPHVRVILRQPVHGQSRELWRNRHQSRSIFYPLGEQVNASDGEPPKEKGRD